MTSVVSSEAFLLLSFIPHFLIGILLSGKVVPSPPFTFYLIINLCQGGFTNIYFYSLVYIQYYVYFSCCSDCSSIGHSLSGCQVGSYILWKCLQLLVFQRSFLFSGTTRYSRIILYSSEFKICLLHFDKVLEGSREETYIQYSPFPKLF